jgi:hypothetical protein
VPLKAFKSELWTVNDDTDTHFYVVDTVGIIQNKIKLPSFEQRLGGDSS